MECDAGENFGDVPADILKRKYTTKKINTIFNRKDAKSAKGIQRSIEGDEMEFHSNVSIITLYSSAVSLRCLPLCG